jgi:hypothetical protein
MLSYVRNVRLLKSSLLNTYFISWLRNVELDQILNCLVSSTSDIVIEILEKLEVRNGHESVLSEHDRWTLKGVYSSV